MLDFTNYNTGIIYSNLIQLQSYISLDHLPFLLDFTEHKRSHRREIHELMIDWLSVNVLKNMFATTQTMFFSAVKHLGLGNHDQNCGFNMF
jgi:hypothetical protein